MVVAVGDDLAIADQERLALGEADAGFVYRSDVTPDIAGQDRANPIGTILSTAMMMFSSFKRPDVSDAIEGAVSQALDEGWRTADLADPSNPDDGLVVVGTTGMATAVIEALEAAVPA